MDLEKLKEVVISEAREEAENLLKSTKEEVQNYINAELDKLYASYNEKREKIEQEFSSKLSYSKFLIESDYRKKLLRAKHNIIEEISTFLTNVLLDKVKDNPEKFITYILKSGNIREGTFFVSKELSNIISENTFNQSLKNINSIAIKFGGVDNELDCGVAIVASNKKYIFPFSEIVGSFIEKNSIYINELLSIND